MTDRSLTAGVITETEAPVVIEVMFVELLFDTPVYLWTGLGSIPATMPGESAQTWVGAGDIGTIDVIGEVTDRKQNGIALGLSGVNNDLLNEVIGEAYQGKSAKIWEAFFNENGTIVADPVLIWAGLMDTMEIADGDPTGTIKLQCESRESYLNRTSRSLLTNEEQQRISSGDLGLAFVAELQLKPLIWGAPNPPGSYGGGSGTGDGFDFSNRFKGF